jgi:hypothetical protein
MGMSAGELIGSILGMCIICLVGGFWTGFWFGQWTGVNIGRFGTTFHRGPIQTWRESRLKQIAALARWHIESETTEKGKGKLRAMFLEKIAEANYDGEKDLEKAGLDVKEIEREKVPYFVVNPFGAMVGCEDWAFPEFICPPPEKKEHKADVSSVV